MPASVVAIGISDEIAAQIGDGLEYEIVRLPADARREDLARARPTSVVIGPDLAQPVAAVTDVAALDPTIPVVLLRFPADRDAVRAELAFVPGIGRQVSICEDADAERVRQILRGAAHRERAAEALGQGLEASQAAGGTAMAEAGAEVIEDLPIGVVTLDTAGAVVGINRAAVQILGWSAEYAQGRRLAERFASDDHDGRLQAVVEGRVVGGGPVLTTLEHPTRRTARHVQLTAVGGDRPVVYLDDVSDLVETHRELEAIQSELETRVADRTSALMRTRRRLELANEDLQNFLYIASHDLSEPLRSIGSYVDLLAARFEPHLDEDAHRHLGYVQAGVERLQILIEGLLTASRLQSHESEFVAVDLLAVVGGLFEDQAQAISDAPTPTVVAVEGPDELWVNTDPVLAGSVIGNLLANAIRYGEDGRANNITVRLTTLDDARVEVAVIDTGLGIPPEHHQRVFEPFRRLSSDRRGTGLGLSIARRAAIRLHGDLTLVDSVPGQGSTFRFLLVDAAHHDVA